MQTLLENANRMADAIGQHVEEEENNRRLSPTVLSALKEAGFHRLFTPKSLGGLEADPVTVAELVEEISLHNTAAGWSMMVANVAAWWCGRLPLQGTEVIYADDHDTFIAGAFHPPMAATRSEGGFKINGRSPLTSNVHEAKWIFVSALVMENGQMKMNDGRPEVIGVFMNSTDCEIIDTWYTLGMKATDSNDVAANDVFVPGHLSFPIAPEFEPNKHYQGNLYKFAAIGAGVACLIAPVALAVARKAIEELKSLAAKKVSFGSLAPIRERGVVQRKLGMAEAMVQSNRAYLYKTIRDCWNKILAGEKLSLEEKAGLLLAATHTNQSCLQAIDLVYSAAGTTGIYTKNKLAHYFTDAQVIRQHGFANDSRYETAAQVYLNLPPDLPVLGF